MATTSLQMPHHAVLNPFQTPNSRQIPMMPIPTHIPPPPMPAGMLQWLITRGPLSRTSPTTISSTSGRSSVSSANGMLNIDLGSQDSGRATGGLASSMSPADEAGQEGEIRHMYEFEIPNSLVGLIIGIKGKTIKELCTRTNVKMIIRPHHTPNKLDTHQICTVEGPRENINKCLQMLRRRFPASRFPELNLEPVLPPPIPSPAAELFGTQPTQV